MSMPSLPERAKNFAKELVKHAMDGNKYVSDEEYNRRLEICSQCELREGEWCPLCGCNMPAKCWWASARCKDGRWDAVK